MSVRIHQSTTYLSHLYMFIVENVLAFIFIQYDITIVYQCRVSDIHLTLNNRTMYVCHSFPVKI